MLAGLWRNTLPAPAAPGKPLTWPSESLSECAGSVDTTSVVCPFSTSAVPSEAEQLVLPTPPLPPSMKYLPGSQGASKRFALVLQADPFAAASRLLQCERRVCDSLALLASGKAINRVCPHNAAKVPQRGHATHF